MKLITRHLGHCRQVFVLAICCVLSWYLGDLVARLVNSEALSATASNDRILELVKPPKSVPVRKRQKCDRWSSCPTGNFAFNVRSGGGLKKYPFICFNDDIIIGEGKSNYGRGINIVAVNASSGKAVGFSSFDMWQGDNSDNMVKFIQQIPPGSLVLMATYDEGSTKLTPKAKAEIRKLGSSLINQISFRSSWVFLGTKGVILPEHLTKERMIHNNPETNVYGVWPQETQIEGCLQRYGS